jgi:hypothetical protein
MQEFLRKHADHIYGVLSCFDRMLFGGYLPVMSGWSMAQFLNSLNLDFRRLKPFLTEHSERLKHHALTLASKQGRPYYYLSSSIRKKRRPFGVSMRTV